MDLASRQDLTRAWTILTRMLDTDFAGASAFRSNSLRRLSSGMRPDVRSSSIAAKWHQRPLIPGSHRPDCPSKGWAMAAYASCFTPTRAISTISNSSMRQSFRSRSRSGSGLTTEETATASGRE